MKKFRARCSNWGVWILLNKRWTRLGGVYSHKKSAKRGAERVAKALGIELVWED